MAISMYDLTIPVFSQGLDVLEGLMQKAHEQLNFRLFPDMYPLVWQVRTTSDHARDGAGRLAGVDMPQFQDDETDFEDLVTRIATTRTAVANIHPQRLEGSVTRPIDFVVAGYQLSFPSGKVYLQQFVVPNFYFHLTTAYNILRHNGVEVGKRDFLGQMGATITPP